MQTLIRPALSLLGLLTLITGIIYPLAITGVAQVAFPRQANGSLILDGNRVIGSELIGQAFDDPRYFWGRPSATSPMPYNAGASTGSNLGPSNPALTDVIKSRIAALHAANPGEEPIPVDLVTASGSGLDPHISPAAAFYQIRRVAKARGLSEKGVRAVIDANLQDRRFGTIGEAQVNVLRLNLALDALRGSGE